VGVLFPIFSASLLQAPQRTVTLFERSLKYTFVFLFPVVLFLVGFSREGLGLWLGTSFVENSSRVLQWLSIGVFLNSLAFIPFAQVQGAGRPDLTAKVHLLELPVYLLCLWFLLHRYGIVGASLAWMFRAGMDTLLLLAATSHVLPVCRAAVHRVSGMMLLAACALAAPVFLPALWSRIIYVAIAITIFCAISWSRLITSSERNFVYERLRV
jgi:O-antigen/teichoic acid export membrane protein